MRRLEKLDLIIKKEIVTVCIALRLLRLKKMGNVKVVNTMLIQSRPIQMRGTILYLANRWMDFKMLSTPNSF